MLRRVCAFLTVSIATVVAIAGGGAAPAGARTVVLSRAGHAGYPALDVNSAGDYVLAWASDDILGPLRVITGSVARDPAARSAATLGDAQAIDPYDVAIATSGRRAAVWHTYSPGRSRQEPAEVRFASSGRRSARWHTRLLVPASALDSTDGPVFDSRGLASELWTTSSGNSATLWLTRETRAGRFAPRRAIYTDHSGAGITDAALRYDSHDHPVIVVNRGSVLGCCAIPAVNASRAAQVRRRWRCSATRPRTGFGYR